MNQNLQTEEDGKIITGVSQSYWYDNTKEESPNKYDESKICFGPCQNEKRKDNEICPTLKGCDCPHERNSTAAWFDRLFEGGIKLPHNHSKTDKPLTVLISGAPGAGKTTLCSEICYNLARKNMDALYFSTQSDTNDFISNTISLGFLDKNKNPVFTDYTHLKKPFLKRLQDNQNDQKKNSDNMKSVYIYGKMLYRKLKNKKDITQYFSELYLSLFELSDHAGTLKKIGVKLLFSKYQLIGTLIQFLFSSLIFSLLLIYILNQPASIFSFTIIPYILTILFIAASGFYCLITLSRLILMVINSLIFRNNKYTKFIKHRKMDWLDIVVFDNLNMMDIEKINTIVDDIVEDYKGAKAIFIVCDELDNNADFELLEHNCDIVIKMNYTSDDEYYKRTLEIVKSRYQPHIQGKHPFIIRPRAKTKNEINQKDDNYNYQNISKVYAKSHPFRQKGGIFIYPAIHYYLSQYKFRPYSHDLIKQEIPINSLNDLLRNNGQDNGGFFQGRCTAFIGDRGCHKSHLAYTQLLHRIDKEECGIIVSLRDDDSLIRTTMKKIYNDFEKKNPIFDSEIDLMEQKNKLDILFFQPDYISPEEMFHRIFISIQKLKRYSKKITLIFNNLEQLHTRLPLCTQNDILIPGLINMLNAEQITSFFMLVSDQTNQQRNQYGLLPMADTILSFNRKKVKMDSYKDAIKKACENTVPDLSKINTELSEMHESHIDDVILKVERFPGGHPAGACGLLQLKDNNNQTLQTYYDRPGLHFTELHGVDWQYSKT